MRWMMMVLVAALACAAQTPAPLFTATSGTACAASWDATAKLLTVECSVNGKAVMPGGVKVDPAQLIGAGNGLVLAVNGVGMIFRRQKEADPLYWEVTSDAVTLKSGTIPLGP